jgi:hypothetical protein
VKRLTAFEKESPRHRRLAEELLDLLSDLREANRALRANRSQPNRPSLDDEARAMLCYHFRPPEREWVLGKLVELNNERHVINHDELVVFVDEYGPLDEEPGVLGSAIPTLSEASTQTHGRTGSPGEPDGAPQTEQAAFGARKPACAASTTAAAATATATAGPTRSAGRARDTGQLPAANARQRTARQVAAAARITDAQTLLLSLPGFGDPVKSQKALQQLRRNCYPHLSDGPNALADGPFKPQGQQGPALVFRAAATPPGSEPSAPPRPPTRPAPPRRSPPAASVREPSATSSRRERELDHLTACRLRDLLHTTPSPSPFSPPGVSLEGWDRLHSLQRETRPADVLADVLAARQLLLRRYLPRGGPAVEAQRPQDRPSPVPAAPIHRQSYLPLNLLCQPLAPPVPVEHPGQASGGTPAAPPPRVESTVAYRPAIPSQAIDPTQFMNTNPGGIPAPERRDAYSPAIAGPVVDQSPLVTTVARNLSLPFPAASATAPPAERPDTNRPANTRTGTEWPRYASGWCYPLPLPPLDAAPSPPATGSRSPVRVSGRLPQAHPPVEVHSPPLGPFPARLPTRFDELGAPAPGHFPSVPRLDPPAPSATSERYTPSPAPVAPATEQDAGRGSATQDAPRDGERDEFASILDELEAREREEDPYYGDDAPDEMPWGAMAGGARHDSASPRRAADDLYGDGSASDGGSWSRVPTPRAGSSEAAGAADARDGGGRAEAPGEARDGPDGDGDYEASPDGKRKSPRGSTGSQKRLKTSGIKEEDDEEVIFMGRRRRTRATGQYIWVERATLPS